MKFEDFDLLKIGNSLEIKGVLYGNTSEDFMIMLPAQEEPTMMKILTPTLEEWNKIVRQSDLLETEIVSGDSNKKIIVRKSTRQIDLSVSWAVFRRDGYKCRYCGNDHVPLTV